MRIPRLSLVALFLTATFALAQNGPPPQQLDLHLPLEQGSVRFAVIGDSGTGDREQYDIAEEMEKYREKVNFDFVIMLGDNIYGGHNAEDMKRKFEIPYKPLLDAGVKFYASLGNHDDPNQRSYKLFNMGGERYYTFKPHKGVQFFALDSNYMDRTQLDWLEKELSASNAEWKIVFCHHPLYSSGAKHGSDVELRKVLEPMFEKHHVALALAGHEHFYERIKPQHGVTYIIEGGSAKLRVGNIRRAEFAAASFDTDNSFMLVEIAGDELYFQAISRAGKTIDSGSVNRPAEAKTAKTGN
jgi:predicted phosphodiesterase